MRSTSGPAAARPKAAPVRTQRTQLRRPAGATSRGPGGASSRSGPAPSTLEPAAPGTSAAESPLRARRLLSQRLVRESEEAVEDYEEMIHKEAGRIRSNLLKRSLALDDLARTHGVTPAGPLEPLPSQANRRCRKLKLERTVAVRDAATDTVTDFVDFLDTHGFPATRDGVVD